MLTHETVERALAKLLKSDLDFHNRRSSNGLHKIHAFAAKFPPQLPRVFIQSLTSRGEKVLDPMCGSGTGLVESVGSDRVAIGVDIDTLALLQSSVKTTALSAESATGAVEKVVEEAKKHLGRPLTLETDLSERFDGKTRDFVDYWFSRRTQRELAALLRAIDSEAENDRIERFLQVVLSSIIVTKSGGVTLARDLAHSRPHLDRSKKQGNAIRAFLQKGIRSSKALEFFREVHAPSMVVKGDARHLPFKSNSMDLVVTSPPYANAIDYPRAHKFSLVWLGHRIAEMTEIRGDYIGAERIRSPLRELPPPVEDVLNKVEERDERRERIIRQYFLDIAKSLAEMERVIKPNRAVVVVVGSSSARGVKIDTHQYLAILGREAGLEVVGVGERRLDRDRRMMPVSNQTSEEGIELRVHEEAVIGFLKPE